MKKEMLKENIDKKYRFVPGAFDPVECLKPQNIMVNSWFYIGRCKSEGHDLAFLLHFMCLSFKNTAGIMDAVVSVLDKTTGFYESSDVLIKTIHPVKINVSKYEIIKNVCAGLTMINCFAKSFFTS